MKTTLLMAITLDGKIGRDAAHLVDWTGRQDKRMFVKLTKAAGVVIMGANTFDTIGRPLPGRKNIVMTRDKTRESADRDLVFTQDPPDTLLEGLEAEGFKTAVLIGGAQVNSVFLKHRLIDEIEVTVVPRIFGEGLSMFSEDTDVKLTLINSVNIDNGHLSMRYTVDY